jgi:hypothetical protein
MARAAESKLAKEVQRLDAQLLAADQLLAGRGPARSRGASHPRPKPMELADYDQRLQELSLLLLIIIIILFVCAFLTMHVFPCRNRLNM